MNRVLILSSVIYILVILALATLNGVLLASAIPFLIYLGAGLLFGPERLDLQAERRISAERVFPGVPVEISLKVTNHGAPLESIVIADQLPDELQLLAGETSMATPLSSGESVEMVYTVKAPRGHFHLREVQVEASEHFGLQRKSTSLKAESRLFVQPRVQQLGRIKIRPRGTRVYAGFIPARKGGPGVEFFGVRQYQQGDPLRWINWHASARHRQSLFINEFEQERVADVGIILDSRRRSEVVADSGASLFEHGVQAAADLAGSFLNDSNRVGLLLYGTHLDWTIPGYGKVQRERILHSLARAEPGNSLIFEKLENLPARLFPANSQLVFISPLQKDDVDTLIQLRARGYSIMVISPDPVAFELAGLNSNDETVTLAARLARIERALMLQKLRQAGIQVLDWNIHTPLNQAIHVALSRPVPQIHQGKAQ